MEVAIKEGNSDSAMEEMVEEAKAMIRVSKHDFIVNFQGISTDNSRVFILLEFCSFGSIDTFLQKRAAIFRPKLENQNFTEVVTWCYQVADAMEFLVSNEIIHVSLCNYRIGHLYLKICFKCSLTFHNVCYK